MIESLQQLSLAVGALRQVDAEKVAEATNRKLVRLLRAQIGKIYWREEAEEGVILKPVTFVNDSPLPDPQRFQVTDQPGGILSWVIHHSAPLWLEHLRGADLNQPVQNEADQSTVPPDYLDMRGDLDSLMTVPLRVRGDTMGLYSIELTESGKLHRGILDYMQRLARYLALLLWSADFYSYQCDTSADAVSQFLNSLDDLDPSILQRHRAGFIARPFEKHFNDVEERLVELLRARGIEARHYEHGGGRSLMIEDIENQIRTSHFCISDLTELNPNVMTEVGMMIAYHKNFLLIRRKGDESAIPFDLNQFPLYEYDLVPGDEELKVWGAADGRQYPFGAVLDRFLANLPAASGFAYAPSLETGDS